MLSKSNSSSSTPVAKPSSSLKNNPPSPAVPQGNAPTPAPAPTPVNYNSGLIQVTGNCGPNGATREFLSALTGNRFTHFALQTGQITSVSGPNGHIDWMNCGFEGAGWNPPYVTVHDIITTPLGTALQDPNSPFKACGPYIHLFETYGGMYGIPAILLASFAMQESSCRPWIVGGGGEQGLMQITVDKCGGAPNGDCKDPVSQTLLTACQIQLILFILGLQHPHRCQVLCGHSSLSWRKRVFGCRNLQWLETRFD